jgi:type I restriction enzyme, S subunit
MTVWQDLTLGDVCELKRGYDLPSGSRVEGTVPVISSSGPTGFHNEAKVQAPGVVTGRYGTLGDVFYISEDFWPLNTALYVRDFKGNDPRYVAALLRSMNLAQFDGAAAVPGLNRNQLHTVPVRIPPFDVQRVVASVLGALDDLIENNGRRVEMLEEMTRAIYREWFVHFRLPGHETAALAESALGPIPEDWRVQPVAAIASKQRHAVTSGPFGSKLGRKDYRDQGVPVLRGANLRLGGGFDETHLVYVSGEKADELRSSLTGPGDIVITQRGTLGQVGMIPPRPRFERYVLSQSQMKITTDAEVAVPGFVYAQMRSESTTRRFIAQAMTAGVPHVNLALLRDFQIVVPPIAVQRLFTDTADPLWAHAFALASQRLSLVALRDSLLPKLVTGELEVPSLNLDALVEGAVA